MIGKLIIIGTGLQLGHLTLESKNAIEGAKKVLYLITDLTTESYIKKLNETAESMINFYVEGKERMITYNEIIDYIIKNLEEYKDLCVAFYGHPGVFTYPSHKAIEKAREKGFDAKMLPGISTEDVIFSEFGIDPGNYGLQTFEASQLLYEDITFDPRCYVIIWQIGVIGVKDYSPKPEIKDQLKKLQTKLLDKYPQNHEIILYLASSHRIFPSTVIKVELKDLINTEFDPISTLIMKPIIS